MATPRTSDDYRRSAKADLLSAFLAFRDCGEVEYGEYVCAVGQRIFGREQWDQCFPMFVQAPPPNITNEAYEQRMDEALDYLADCHKWLHYARAVHAAGIIDNLARSIFDDEPWALAVRQASQRN